MLKKGVPQGSVLRPLLSSAYINDLPNQVINSKCHFYTDDVQLVLTSSIKQGPKLINQINSDLSRVYQSACDNELVLNPNKLVSMVFSRQQQPFEDWPKIEINKTTIPYTSVAKNLGVWFDERLNWTHHTNKTCNAVYGSISRLRKNVFAMPESSCKKH